MLSIGSTWKNWLIVFSEAQSLSLYARKYLSFVFRHGMFLVAMFFGQLMQVGLTILFNLTKLRKTGGIKDIFPIQIQCFSQKFQHLADS